MGKRDKDGKRNGRPLCPIRENRLRRTEEMMLRGVKNRFQIAAAHGISVPQASKDMAEIRKRWLERDPASKEHLSKERVVQLESLLQKSVNAFDRSRIDEEFRIVANQCERCGGTGNHQKDGISEPCRSCNATGKIVSQTTVTRESPGDPSFLKVAKDCIVEIAKLQGLYPEKSGSAAAVALGSVRTITEKAGIGGNIREQVEELYLQAPVDVLLATMAALDNLKHASKNPQKSEVLPTTVANLTYNEGEAGNATPEQ